MEQAEVIENLLLFGLTRQEAAVYFCLNRNPEMTGYEGAKLTGISRSNVYNALAGLVEKGAAYLVEGNTNKYTPVPVSQFCENRIRRLRQVSSRLEEAVPDMPEAADGYITITGCQHILDKIHHMIMEAEQRLYISAERAFILQVKPELEDLCHRGIKVVIMTDYPQDIGGSIIYLSGKKEKQVHLITDSKYVLTGEVTGSAGDTCLYSGQKYFVAVLKEALRNEIKLIELTGGEACHE